MRRRLLALFVVASISGAVAGTVASATGRPEATGARIPPLPVLREVANLCPVPQLYRPAFTRAAHDVLGQFHSTDLVLAAYNAGPTAVAEAGGAPTTETVQYVGNVTTLWRELRGCR